MKKAAAEIETRRYGDQAASHVHDHHQLVLPLAGALEMEIAGQGGRVIGRRAASIPGGEAHSFLGTEENAFLIVDISNSDSSLPLSDGQRFWVIAAERAVFDFDPEMAGHLAFVASAVCAVPGTGDAAQNSVTQVKTMPLIHARSLANGSILGTISGVKAMNKPLARSLSDYTTLTFDCYGTLIDWESGIWDAYQPLIMAGGRADITRDSAMVAHARLESAQQAATPGMLYPALLARVHMQFAHHYDLETTAEMDAAFGASVPHWPAFPDTADALRRLKKRYKLVILSNVNRAGFAASNAKLGVVFDAIYTAEDVGSYKPDRRNFEHMLARLEADHGIARGQILHTAQSLFHDHVPASDFGLAKAWIDRQGLSEGGTWGATAEVAQRPQVDFLLPTMAAMADAVDAD